MLRAEGYRVILANSNPAIIMTDPEVADATYVEPLDADHRRRRLAVAIEVGRHHQDRPSSGTALPWPYCVA